MIDAAGKLFAMCCAVVLLASCASTKLINEWRDPNYSAQPFGKILVIGITKQSATRRILEDEFVHQLTARGIQAVQSYQLIAEDGEVPKERLAQAVQQAGADGVLISRLVKVERQTQIYPGAYMGPPYLGFYGFYSSAWMGFYDPPQVYTYDVVTWEVNLFDSRTDRLVWAGTTETFSPRSFAKDASEFAKIIIKELADKKLIQT
jgi:hypothetical protein